ncbi:hypothetical protein, partial [Salmonella enterica]|uniref:hypothetical protein n=1 Tax=Salmonella enterica TaxID=28901 RepID=UPI00398C446A
RKLRLPSGPACRPAGRWFTPPDSGIRKKSEIGSKAFYTALPLTRCARQEYLISQDNRTCPEAKKAMGSYTLSQSRTDDITRHD